MPLNLTKLLSLIEEMPAYHQLAQELLGENNSTKMAVLNAAKPYFIAALYHTRRVPMLVVTAQPEDSKKLYEQLQTWCNSSQIKLLPEPDTLPYQHVASDTSTELERIQVLSALINQNEPTLNLPLVIASAPAIRQKITPYSDFLSTFHTIKLGMDIEPLELIRQWEAIGYDMENLVEVPGTISHRGGIIDIYPSTSDLPIRLEFT